VLGELVVYCFGSLWEHEHRENSLSVQCVRLELQGSFALLKMTGLIFWVCFL